MYNNVILGYAPQGWQCPVCGRVYSPSTTMCFYCNNSPTNTNSNGTFKVEYGHTDSKTEGVTEK